MRGKRARKHPITPDSKYQSELVAKFINNMMISGKKKQAIELVYDAMEILAKESKLEALEAFQTAIENIKPKVEVKSRRIGGANYQVPTPVNADRQQALAIRWIINAARESRKKESIVESLGKTLIQSLNKEGAAYKKREDTHKMAEANKAFAQFAW
jgi:small subunit ribosomal protein S7